METDADVLGVLSQWHTLKPSLEGWKHALEEDRSLLQDPLKPSLEGWKHGTTIAAVLRAYTLKPSLEGWKRRG